VLRASQPSPRAIESLAATGAIRTIVNLRGANSKKAWYRDEEEAARRAGVELISLRFETFDWPPRIETLKLVEALERAPRPILIHCESGLDRSGWAAAVARILAGETSDDALGELSPWKGHFCRRDSCALHQFFAMYEDWINRTGLPDSRESFLRWVRQAYYPQPYAAAIALESVVPPDVAAGSRVALRAKVVNRSTGEWSATDDKSRGVRLGVRIIGPLAHQLPDQLEAFRVPHSETKDVFRDGNTTGAWKPGDERTIEIVFDAPRQPGRYLAQIDMVDEQVHWFSDLGDGGVVIELNVGQ
jgi:protein tyrosine phosphatase (PTP) superfamily phosphohydrolase (DUF442 family)